MARKRYTVEMWDATFGERKAQERFWQDRTKRSQAGPSKNWAGSLESGGFLGGVWVC